MKIFRYLFCLSCMPFENSWLSQVKISVAVVAQGDQVLLAVVAQIAARRLVMEFQICSIAADLAAPPIPRQDLPPQLISRLPTEPLARSLLAKMAHFPIPICARKTSLWIGGKS
jgi:hypothetical protein